jgi:predicted transcriptional regulator
MRGSTVTFYATQADSRERDPIVVPGEHGRADVANGRMGRWARFNRADDLIWIDTPSGTTIGLTRKQLTTLQAIRRLAGSRVRVTTRHLSSLLGVAPSTISRTSVKLASLGLIAYQTNRGRNGGTIYVLRAADDLLGWFQEAAKDRVRAWARAQEARISRLRVNVASYVHGGNRGINLVPVYNSSRTQHLVRAWTPGELREAGIL